jgi:hypothetical protein
MTAEVVVLASPSQMISNQEMVLASTAAAPHDALSTPCNSVLKQHLEAAGQGCTLCCNLFIPSPISRNVSCTKSAMQRWTWLMNSMQTTMVSHPIQLNLIQFNSIQFKKQSSLAGGALLPLQEPPSCIGSSGGSLQTMSSIPQKQKKDGQDCARSIRSYEQAKALLGSLVCCCLFRVFLRRAH